MKMLLAIVGVFEAVTGVALVVAPLLVGRLLLGAELAGVALPIARLTGVALLALGVGCVWRSVWRGMFIYNGVAFVYLVYLGVGTEWVGALLWPAVVVHGVVTVLLGWVRFRRRVVGVNGEGGGGGMQGGSDGT